MHKYQPSDYPFIEKEMRNFYTLRDTFQKDKTRENRYKLDDSLLYLEHTMRAHLILGDISLVNYNLIYDYCACQARMN